MPADNFLWFPEAAKGGNLTGKSSKPEGETTDKFFSSLKALEILSFSFGVAQAQTVGSAAGGASAGKSSFEEFSIEKAVDLASTPLYVACAAGAHFPTVCLAVRKAGGSNLLYLQYIFRMVFVTNVSWNGGGGDEAPKESVKFRFGAMGIQYIKQNPDGTEGTKMVGMWDVLTNKPDLAPVGLGGAPDFLKGTQ